MTRTISSQRFTNEAIVDAKLAAQDFVVTVSPEFAIEGETFRIVLDGHHSLAAASLAGVAPEFVEIDGQDIGAMAILENEGPEALLEDQYLDSDYYDIATGDTIW